MPERQRTIEEVMGATGQVAKKVELNDRGRMTEVIDMINPAASSKLSPPLVEVMRKVQETMYRISSFYNVYFRELVDDSKLTREECLLNSADLMLGDPTYNVRCGQKDVSSHYNALHIEDVAGAIAICSVQ